MKNTKKKLLSALTAVVVLFVVLYFTIAQVFGQSLKSFSGKTNFTWSAPKLDVTKKTVFIIASNEGTELFDFMAPYYLFNVTELANVYVVAERKAPVLLVNSLFILPHYTFSEIDSLHITPDVVVIPNITVHLMKPPKENIVNWVKSHVGEKTILLSICDGSATAAATGLYDGKPLTTHASDFEKLKKQFPKPKWVRNTSVTESGNLYSTAGVSNAVEGSLTVIKRVFGEETMNLVLNDIKYPYASVKTEHQSKVVNTGAIFRIVTKKVFKKNYKVGVLLDDNINEFELGSILDTYVRTFPSSLNTYSLGEKAITSKYGLQLFPTGSMNTNTVDELHITSNNALYHAGHAQFPKAHVVNYNDLSKKYPFEICLDRIEELYGDKFKNNVKLMLDYN